MEEQETEILITNPNTLHVSNNKNTINVVKSPTIKTTNQFDINYLLSDSRKKHNKQITKRILHVFFSILAFEAILFAILRTVNIRNNSWKYAFSNIAEFKSESLGESSLTVLNLFLIGTFTIHMIWLILNFIYYVFFVTIENNMNNNNNIS